MSYKLTSKTKETLSRIIGIPYEKLIQMEDEEIEAFIEQRTWNKYQKNYEYAKGINYEQLVDSISSIKELYFK